MKTELTTDNKCKLFYHYYGQKVLVLDEFNEPYHVWNRFIELLQGRRDTYGYLLLTPLYLITDEDAIELAKISGIKPENILKEEEAEGESIVDRSDEFGLHINVKYWYESIGETTEWDLRDFSIYLPSGDVSDTYGCANNIASVIDYLRSKGYALPWMGLTVDEMIQAGWVKLQETTEGAKDKQLNSEE